MIDLLRPLLSWTEAIGIAVALFLLGPIARPIVRMARIKRVWKDRILRLLPGAQIIAWSAYSVWVVGSFVSNRETSNLIAVGLVVGILVVSTWSAARDVINGAILRMEDVYSPGEWIRVGDIAGRIHGVGIRSLELELQDGKRLRVPYSVLTAGTIEKAEAPGLATAHSFSVNVPRALSVAKVKAQVQQAALLCMWSSTCQPPRVETALPTPERLQLDITVFALHPDYDLEVEAAVRGSLAELSGKSSGE